MQVYFKSVPATGYKISLSGDTRAFLLTVCLEFTLTRTEIMDSVVVDVSVGGKYVIANSLVHHPIGREGETLSKTFVLAAANDEALDNIVPGKELMVRISPTVGIRVDKVHGSLFMTGDASHAEATYLPNVDPERIPPPTEAPTDAPADPPGE